MDQLDREMSELIVGAGAIIGLDEIARHQHRPQPPRLAAADIAGLDAVRRGQRANDRAMLAMRAEREDDGGGVQVHRRPVIPAKAGIPCLEGRGFRLSPE